MTWWATVPTDWTRPWLPGIVRACESRIVIVDGTGPVNIGAWWALGVELAPSRFVAVLNDDVEFQTAALDLMEARLLESGAAICYPNEQAILTGWAFMLDREQVRPDPQFRYWYGDRDLHRTAGTKVTGVDVEIVHHHDPYRVNDPVLSGFTETDRVRYIEKWGDDHA